MEAQILLAFGTLPSASFSLTRRGTRAIVGSWSKNCKIQQALRWLAVCAGVLLLPVIAHANQTSTVNGQPASAAVHVSIVIPAVLRILENSHPLALPPLNILNTLDRLSSHTSAQQRMVLVSTLGKGFCIDLRLSQLQISDWQLKISGTPGAWLEPVLEGYKLCAARAGRYELTLQHDFFLKGKDQRRADPSTALAWPVYVSFALP